MVLMLEPLNKEMTVMLVPKFILRKLNSICMQIFLLFRWENMAVDHVSENQV